MNFVLFVLFVVLLFLVLFLYARLKDEIKNVKGKGVVEEIKKEIEALIVEFNKISNRKIIVMDEKMKELENLIKLAEDKIAKLDTLTRNYAEMVKRYEIAKKEFQSALINKPIQNLTSNTRPTPEGNIKTIYNEPIYEETQVKPEKKKQLKTKESFNQINLETPNKLDYETSKRITKEESTYNVEDIKDKKELLEREIQNIKLEELEMDVRAELLRKLLSLNFDEDKLVEMGFSPSEIEITKIVISNKR